MKSHYLVKYFKHLEEDFSDTFCLFSDTEFIIRVPYYEFVDPRQRVYGEWLELAARNGIMAWIERKT